MRLRRDVDVEHTPTLERQYEEHIHDTEGHGRHCQKSDRSITLTRTALAFLPSYPLPDPLAL